MTLSEWLANIGAVATLALGVLGLFWPGTVARMVSISPVGARGRAEVRATYGGLFAAMAVLVLLAQDRYFFALVGTAWVGAGVGRLLSVRLDSCREARNIAGIAMELLLGYMLLAPALVSGWRGLT